MEFMIKNVKTIFVLLFVTSILSLSFIDKDMSSIGLNIGDKAPNIRLNLDEQVIDLRQMEGSMVLISFWASFDASSRLTNANLYHAIQGMDNIKMVSVSFDDYQSIFEDAINKDLISSDNCFMKRFDRSTKEYRTYQVENGFKNYLLNENGTIIAKDLNSEELKKYLN